MIHADLDFRVLQLLQYSVTTGDLKLKTGRRSSRYADVKHPAFGPAAPTAITLTELEYGGN